MVNEQELYLTHWGPGIYWYIKIQVDFLGCRKYTKLLLHSSEIVVLTV